MGVFLLSRIATLLATVFGTSVVIFLVLEILPGDPALVILGVEASPDALAALRAEMGLDRPAVARYLSWIGGLLQGESAISFTYGVSVASLIGERLQVTVPLALISMALAALIALSAGIYAASRQSKAGDLTVMTASQIGIAVPSFWLAMLMIILFAVNWRILPSGGFPGWEAGLLPALRALVLPALALAIVQAAILTRIVRSSVIDVMREDFARTARAKGLRFRAVLWRHVLRNAMIPVITMMGLQFANMLAGTIIIEQVFSLPGLGRLMFQAIGQRDLVVIKDAVLMLAAIVIFVNFIVDVLYASIDPRIKLGAGDVSA